MRSTPDAVAMVTRLEASFKVAPTAPQTQIQHQDTGISTSIMTSTQSEVEQQQPSPEPYPQPPTREFLNNNFHKADLQKRCRELGLTKIWVNKDQLIEMIIRNTPPPSQNPDAASPVSSGLPSLDVTVTSVPHSVTPLDIAQVPCVENTQTQCPDETSPTTVPTSQTSNTADEQIPAPPPGSNQTSPAADTGHPTAIPASQEGHTADAGQTTSGPALTPPAEDVEQPFADDTHSPKTPLSSDDNGDRLEMTLLKVNKDIETIMLKLHTKDTEIDLLNTEVKTAYTIIQHLQQRVSELELQVKNQDSQQEAIDHVATSSRCLLLGDSNVRRVLRSDLHENCSVKTVARANMDLLRCWVNEQLKATPGECEIYCGLYDILEGKTPENILDCLGSLVSDLKERNSNMVINVCQIVPVPVSVEVQCSISDYNEQLVKWGEANGVGVVKTTPEFTLGTGSVDELCFEDEENRTILMNRLGVIRLLNTIEKQCSGFKLSSDWVNIKRNSRNFYNNQTERKNQSIIQVVSYPQQINMQCLSV